jgi:hypothetical protein
MKSNSKQSASSSHISDQVRAQLDKLGPEKKARVLEVADETRPSVTDPLSGRPAIGTAP